jgi:hypothetical protein
MPAFEIRARYGAQRRRDRGNEAGVDTLAYEYGIGGALALAVRGILQKRYFNATDNIQIEAMHECRRCGGH